MTKIVITASNAFHDSVPVHPTRCLLVMLRPKHDRSHNVLDSLPLPVVISPGRNNVRSKEFSPDGQSRSPSAHECSRSVGSTLVTRALTGIVTDQFTMCGFHAHASRDVCLKLGLDHRNMVVRPIAVQRRGDHAASASARCKGRVPTRIPSLLLK